MKKIGIACSAGVDSQVLLHWALNHLEVSSGCDRTIFSILHFNHQLRKESDSECEFMQKQAEHLGLKFYCAQPKNQYTRGSLELWARQERYAFFSQVIQEESLDEIWTAHHQDDQIETLWMRLERGTGLKGLKGIEEFRPFVEVYTGSELKNASIIRRPFLNWTKSDIISYAKMNQVQWKDDSSNQDLKFRRNFWRHEGRDQMETKFLSQQTPSPNLSLLQISQKVKEIWPKIQSDFESFRGRWKDLLNEDEEFICLCVSSLYPNHVAFSQGWTSGRVLDLKKWWREGVKVFYPLNEGWGLERRSQDLVLTIFNRQETSQFDDFQAETPSNCRGLELKSSESAEKSSLIPSNQAVLGDKMYFLETQKSPSSPMKEFEDGAFSTLLELEDIDTPIELRTRQPGDLFSPAPGRFLKRTLKKFMNEVGIPASQRASLPLVVQGSRVLWIPNWGVSGLHQEKSSKSTTVGLKIICQSMKNAT